MKVMENTGSKVTVQLEAEEAAQLVGHRGVCDALIVQVQLADQITESWYEAGCPPPEGGGR